VIDLETAVARIRAEMPAPQPEPVPLAAARGRVLAESVRASLDLPPFTNSAVDGYAVRAAETSGASVGAPVRLRRCGRVAAGDSAAILLGPGECARVFTGAPVPVNADAVVMQEDTRQEADQVWVLDAALPGENVRDRGEDVRCGAEVAGAGTEVSEGVIGLLGALGVGSVQVGRRPRVGILVTGSELREAGATLAPGQIYESNRAMLAALVERSGGVARSYPIVADTLAATRAALERALGENDLVVTCGGVSVGKLDFVKEAFEACGGTLHFWRIAMRPGKPFVFGRWNESFLFGLPGNPVSAFVTYLLLVRPAVRHWQGAAEVTLPSRPAVLGEAIGNPGDRRHFVRVRWDDSGRVVSAGKQGSHVLTSLAAAQALLEVPPQTQWAAGRSVTVLSLA
jgi:molybdopterin molybdotransferase